MYISFLTTKILILGFLGGIVDTRIDDMTRYVSEYFYSINHFM